MSWQETLAKVVEASPAPWRSVRDGGPVVVLDANERAVVSVDSEALAQLLVELANAPASLLEEAAPVLEEDKPVVETPAVTSPEPSEPPTA